ncbi:hypothetical protein BH11MYX4_BH11MYX4_64150 [soil metagenome]
MIPSPECALRRFAFTDDEVGDRVLYHMRIGAPAEHRALTLREARDLAIARASALHALGCRRGERIALLIPPSERLITTFLGCLYMGLVPSILAWPTAKIDPSKYQRNVTGIMRGLAADWLLTQDLAAEALGAAVGTTKVLLTDQLMSTVASPIPPAPLEEGTAFIQFSGGTTGTQKSVPVSHALLHNALTSYAASLDLRADDHLISWLPLYHDMGLIANLLMPFVFRLPVTVFAPMEWITDPLPYLRAIGEQRATLTWMPNFAFGFLADRVDLPAGALDLSSMRAFNNGSEPARVETIDAFIEKLTPHGLDPKSIHSAYGMAEAVLAIAQTSAVDPPRRLTIASTAFGQGRLQPAAEGNRMLISCGSLVRGIALRVVGAADEECAPCAIGELWIKGPNVMEDYLDAAASEKGARWAFTEGGWFRTGDLGAILDGHVYVTGRKKDLIIAAGVNIYPDEVEMAVSRVDGVHAGRVVAMGIEDASSGTELFVIIAEVDDAADLADAAPLEQQVRAAATAVTGVSPDRVHIVPPRWMIKSTAGKVSRPETKEKLRAQTARVRSQRPAPPMLGDLASIDAYLRRAIASTMGATVESLGDAPLQGLGLGSLAVTRLLSQIRRDVRVTMSYDTFMAAITVRDLAEELTHTLGKSGASPVTRPPVARTGASRAPLSFTQTDFWEWEQRWPGTPAWNVVQACAIDALDPVALNLAAGGVARRHEALRTSFVVQSGRPVQVVAPPGAVSIPSAPVLPRDGETVDECVVRTAREEVSIPFDLARGPLYRWRLLELGPGRHILLFTAHHLVVDSFGLTVLFNDLGRLYVAARAGTSAALPPLAIQYPDYAAWQQEATKGPAVLKDLAYWRDQLAGMQDLSLAEIVGEPARDTLTCLKLEAQPLIARVSELATREKTTPYTITFAALCIALRRIGAGDDIVVVAPVANRDEVADVQSMVGMFVDRVLLRLDLGGSPSHRELLARADKVMVESRTHSRAPSGLVLAGEGPPRLLRSFCALNFLPATKPEAAEGLRFPYFLPIWPGFPDGHRLFSDIMMYLVPTPQGPDFILGTNLSNDFTTRLASTFTSSLEALLTDLDAPI